MSNFVVAVGGSGAKLMQSLIHLGAAGMLPEKATTLSALVVGPDENNGNIEECLNIEKAYQACRQIKGGNTDLFRAHLSLAGPWTPIGNSQSDTLKEIFNYNQLANNASEEAELMDLFFEPGELEMSVKQGQEPDGNVEGHPGPVPKNASKKTGGALTLRGWCVFEPGIGRRRRSFRQINLSLAHQEKPARPGDYSNALHDPRSGDGGDGRALLQSEVQGIIRAGKRRLS